MISVIVPTYNYEHYIGQTLNSVLAQTYNDFEVIVIDDGSKDNTKEVVESFHDPRLRYIYQENRGACAARNRGIRGAIGDYLLFEDADDILEAGHLQEYMKVANKHPGCNVYGPAVKVRIENGEYKILEVRGKCPGDDLLEQWIGHWAIWTNCILWPRENIDKVGGWDETLHASQDSNIGMRAVIEGIRFVYAENAPAAKYLRHEEESEQISSTRNKKTVASKVESLERIEKLLFERGAMTRRYKNALGKQYYSFARMFLDSYPDISDECFNKFRKFCGFRKPPGSYLNWIGILLFGLRRKEKIAEFLWG